MTDMNYDDAWELSLLMRTKADSFEKSAAEMDRFANDKGASEATKDWANKAQIELRERAKVFRLFARENLRKAEQTK